MKTEYQILAEWKRDHDRWMSEDRGHKAEVLFVLCVWGMAALFGGTALILSCNAHEIKGEMAWVLAVILGALAIVFTLGICRVVKK